MLRRALAVLLVLVDAVVYLLQLLHFLRFFVLQQLQVDLGALQRVDLRIIIRLASVGIFLDYVLELLEDLYQGQVALV